MVPAKWLELLIINTTVRKIITSFKDIAKCSYSKNDKACIFIKEEHYYRRDIIILI